MIHPEGQLLLASARQFVGAGPAAPELLRGVTDWDRLFRLASWHGLSPALARLAGDPELPGRCVTPLRAESRDRARRGLRLTSELLKVLGVLESSGIPAAPFKGPVLSSALYGDVASREFHDIDILIRREDALRVKGALLAGGWRCSLPEGRRNENAYLRARYELPFESEDGNCLIEVHQSFLAPSSSLRIDYELLWRRLERKPFYGHEILSLAPGDLLLALCAHGAKHSWARLQWQCDIARLLIVQGRSLDWDRIMDTARACGASRILHLGLFLAKQVLHAPVPPEIAGIGERDARTAALGRRVIGSLFREDGTSGGHLFFLQTRERLRDRLACCARLAFAPNEEDRFFVPLPAWLSPLYYPLHAIRVAGKFGFASLSNRE